MADGDASTAAIAADDAGLSLTIAVPVQQPLHFFGARRVEQYDGENQDQDELAALISPPELPASLLEILNDDHVPAPTGATDLTLQVELGQNNDQKDLDTCLSRGKWEDALEILAQIVHRGEALNEAIDGVQVDPNDIRSCHPELVLLLRGQAYFDRKDHDSSGAQAYYRDYISAIYPEGTSTGSAFVDNLLARIRTTATTGAILRGEPDFTDGAKTERAVYDYLKLYFPAFKPELEEGTSQVWLLGERNDRRVRCFACHKEFKNYDKSKLRFHLLGSRAGKQVKCRAVTNYILAIVQKTLVDEGFNPDGTSRKTTDAGPAVPTPSDAAALLPVDNADPDAAAPPPLAADNGPSDATALLPAISAPSDAAALLSVDNGDTDAAAPSTTAPPLAADNGANRPA
ncbi:hypothetical protein ACP70R_028478 [Stipagrostis hirtigluma subsp. patula]